MLYYLIIYEGWTKKPSREKWKKSLNYLKRKNNGKGSSFWHANNIESRKVPGRFHRGSRKITRKGFLQISIFHLRRGSYLGISYQPPGSILGNLFSVVSVVMSWDTWGGFLGTPGARISRDPQGGVRDSQILFPRGANQHICYIIHILLYM